MTKKEMTSLAKEMIAQGQLCLKSNFKKSFPYSEFKEVYESVRLKIFESGVKKRDREEVLKAAKENKMRVSDFSRVVELLREIDLSKYRTGHSMGYSADVYMGGFYVSRYNGCNTPPRAYGYRPTYGYYTIRISLEIAKELAKGYKYEIIGGVETFVKVSDAKIKECFWISQSGAKHTYGVELVSGFVTGGFHGETYTECETWRTQQAKRLLKSRADTFASRVSEHQKALEIERKKQRFVGISHSKAVGNCEVGTISFAKKHNLNPEYGYQIGYLLELEDSPFTRRLLNAHK